LRKENEDLKESLGQKDVKIRNLELEIEKLKTSLAEMALTVKVGTAAAEDESTSSAAAAATAAAEEEQADDGVSSSNSVSGNAEDVELPHNSNSLTE
jgi:hypothetical protein